MRDATEAELMDEPSGALEAMVEGDVDATWTTREMARRELERRGDYRNRPFHIPGADNHASEARLLLAGRESA